MSCLLVWLISFSSEGANITTGRWHPAMNYLLYFHAVWLFSLELFSTWRRECDLREAVTFNFDWTGLVCLWSFHSLRVIEKQESCPCHWLDILDRHCFPSQQGDCVGNFLFGPISLKWLSGWYSAQHDLDYNNIM